jgi:acetyl esterase/lipase
VRRHRYADDHEAQHADLRLPQRDSRGTVVLLHGGYWQPPYGADLMERLAVRLTALGWATWNVEYRLTGAGGGFPHTLLDVAAAVDHLADPALPSGLADDVVLLGHSAGGHLAAWAASRSGRTPGGVPTVAPAGAISLSGVLELTRAATAPGSADPVQAFMGGSPSQVPGDYAVADPSLLVPPGCPVWAAHADADAVVPSSQSTGYVEHVTAAGGSAEYVALPGDHVSVIDPDAASFPTLQRLVTAATTASLGSRP